MLVDARIFSSTDTDPPELAAGTVYAIASLPKMDAGLMAEAYLIESSTICNLRLSGGDLTLTLWSDYTLEEALVESLPLSAIPVFLANPKIVGNDIPLVEYVRTILKYRLETATGE
jgi:hypothetical protein